MYSAPHGVSLTSRDCLTKDAAEDAAEDVAEDGEVGELNGEVQVADNALNQVRHLAEVVLEEVEVQVQVRGDAEGGIGELGEGGDEGLDGVRDGAELAVEEALEVEAGQGVGEGGGHLLKDVVGDANGLGDRLELLLGEALEDVGDGAGGVDGHVGDVGAGLVQGGGEAGVVRLEVVEDVLDVDNVGDGVDDGSWVVSKKG